MIGCFVATVLLGVAFVVSSRRHRAPLLDPQLLRLPSFAIGSLATVVAGFGFYAYLLTNILWLTYVWGYDVLTAGLALVPGALVAAVVAARLGPLTERYGYRVFVVPGALVWAGAYLWYHQMVGLEPAFWSEWLPGQVLSGIGVGATLPLLGSASLAAVPGGRYATASAVTSSARQLGGVLGIAILVVILGEPTPATAVDAFRDGWVLSIVAFVLVAVIALPLGRLRRADEDSDDDVQPAVVHAPAPPASWLRPTDAVRRRPHRPLRRAAPHRPAARGPAPARARGAARRRCLPGRLLIREGDPPGSAFVVRRGRLEVEVGGRVVRELGSGEVIGEIALLTGEQRSAAVRARRDSTVLEIPRDAFESMLDRDPAAPRIVLSQVRGPAAHRRVTARPAAPERLGVVSVVGLHDGARVPAVVDELVRRMSAHLSVAAPGVVEPAGLARAERDHDRVVLASEAPRGPADVGWRDVCVRQADAVVLVARSDAPVPGMPFELAPASQPELVLVGPAPTHELRAAWVAATDARQLTIVDGDLAVGPARPRRPARRPVARPRPRRRRGPRLLPHRRAARARGRGPARRPGGGQQHRRGHRRAARDRDGRSVRRGAVLRRVGAPPALQRLAAADDVPREGPPRAQRDGAQPGRGQRHRGAAAPAPGGQRRPRVPHPPGAPSWQRRRRGPGVGAAAGALRPHAPGRRAAARRRRRARQPADRPARRARRGTRRRGQHRCGEREPAHRSVPACPRSARR